MNNPAEPVTRIQADAIYTTRDIINTLHVTQKTVTNWYRLGLEFTPVSLHPKAKRFVMGEALIEFLRSYGMALRILRLMGEIPGSEDETES